MQHSIEDLWNSCNDLLLQTFNTYSFYSLCKQVCDICIEFAKENSRTLFSIMLYSCWIKKTHRHLRYNKTEISWCYCLTAFKSIYYILDLTNSEWKLLYNFTIHVLENEQKNFQQGYFLNIEGGNAEPIVHNPKAVLG